MPPKSNHTVAASVVVKSPNLRVKSKSQVIGSRVRVESRVTLMGNVSSRVKSQVPQPLKSKSSQVLKAGTQVESQVPKGGTQVQVESRVTLMGNVSSRVSSPPANFSPLRSIELSGL